MIDYINKSDYKTKINDFSKSFAKTCYDSFFTEDKDDLNIGNYSERVRPILKRLNESTYKNTIIVDMCNEMQSSITKPDNEFSKLRFFNSIDEDFNEIPNYIRNDPNPKVMERFIQSNNKRKLERFKISEETKYASILSILDSLLTFCTDKEIEEIKGLEKIKDYIKDPNIYGIMYVDLLCKGKTEEDKIKKYFKVIKKIGFNATDIVKSTINNISKREDIYPFVKEPLINKLFAGFEKYKKEKGKIIDFSLKKELDKIKKLVDSNIAEIRKKEMSVTNEKGDLEKISFNTRKELLNLFFEQQKKIINNTKERVINSTNEQLKQELERTIENDQTKLENNKIIIKTLRQNDPGLLYDLDVESYDKDNKEASITKASSVLANLLWDKSNSQDTLNKYFNSFENLGFPINELVISTIKSINKDKNIYPFVRKAIIDNLSNACIDYMKQPNKQIKYGELLEFGKTSGEIIREINKENDEKGESLKIKNKDGKLVNLDLKSESLNSFLDQEEKWITDLDYKKFDKKKMLSALSKNKTIIQNLKQKSPELFVKNNEKGVSGISY